MHGTEIPSITLQRFPSERFDVFVELWLARLPVGPLVCLTATATKLRHRNLAVADVSGVVEFAALASDVDTVLLIVEDPTTMMRHLVVRSTIPNLAQSVAERFGGTGTSVSAHAILPRSSRLSSLRDTVIQAALAIREEMSQ